jgi:hypothetical protein
MGTDTDRRNYRVSFAKIRELLNFTPQWTVEKGIEQVIAALRSGVVRDYQEARYSNAKFLTEQGSSILSHYPNGWAHELLNGGSLITIAASKSRVTNPLDRNGKTPAHV